MKNTDRQPPFERFYDLNRLSEAGFETTIALDPDDRARLAQWADVVGVNRFEGHVSLRRISPTRFAYTGSLKADITQTCTVTLAPVFSSIVLDFTRTLHVVPHAKAPIDFSSELSPAAGDGEVPEEIKDTRYDLAAPLLEEFSLAIDPYPRVPGAIFEAPEEPGDIPESPFGVLRKLKKTR